MQENYDKIQQAITTVEMIAKTHAAINVREDCFIAVEFMRCAMLTHLKLIQGNIISTIIQVTAEPKPDYTLDGQTVSWADYLAKLRDTVNWCDQMIAGSKKS